MIHFNKRLNSHFNLIDLILGNYTITSLAY